MTRWIHIITCLYRRLFFKLLVRLCWNLVCLIKTYTWRMHLSIFFFLEDRVSLCSSGCPGTLCLARLASNPQKSICLYLPSVRIKDIYHHTWRFSHLLIFNISTPFFFLKKIGKPLFIAHEDILSQVWQFFTLNWNSEVTYCDVFSLKGTMLFGVLSSLHTFYASFFFLDCLDFYYFIIFFFLSFRVDNICTILQSKETKLITTLLVGLWGAVALYGTLLTYWLLLWLL